MAVPQPNCNARLHSGDHHALSACTPCDEVRIQPISARVRYTAIGSFMPDSISRVAATRSFRRTPDDLRSENTAAASVEPTMAPSNSAICQFRPSSQCAATPVMAALMSTPSVASHSEGFRPVRKVLWWVRNPPSSRITARATLPTQKARR